MTIWVNKRTGATRNQYTKPAGNDWEKKKEGYSRSSAYDSSPYYSPSSDNFMGVGVAVAVATGLI